MYLYLYIDLVFERHSSYHWTTKYACLFHATRKDTRHHLLFGWHLPCSFKVPCARLCSWSVWFLESIWVRAFSGGLVRILLGMLITEYSDFFPVVFGFVRRLPIIGPILSHPAIARVRTKQTTPIDWKRKAYHALLVYATWITHTRLNMHYSVDLYIFFHSNR